MRIELAIEAGRLKLFPVGNASPNASLGGAAMSRVDSVFPTASIAPGRPNERRASQVSTPKSRREVLCVVCLTQRQAARVAKWRGSAAATIKKTNARQLERSLGRWS